MGDPVSAESDLTMNFYLIDRRFQLPACRVDKWCHQLPVTQVGMMSNHEIQPGLSGRCWRESGGATWICLSDTSRRRPFRGSPLGDWGLGKMAVISGISEADIQWSCWVPDDLVTCWLLHCLKWPQVSSSRVMEWSRDAQLIFCVPLGGSSHGLLSSGSDAYDISKLKALTKGEEPYEVTFGNSAAHGTVTCGTRPCFSFCDGEIDSTAVMLWTGTKMLKIAFFNGWWAG